MRISPSVRLGAAALGLAVAAIPAIGQDRPESILPPGFGEPVTAPTPTPRPSAPIGPTPSASPLVAPPPGSLLPSDLASPTPAPSATATPEPIDPAILAQYELPFAARRSLAIVGPAGPREGGVAADSFGDADGQYLEALMRRVAAPLPSRWLSIALRRTLASSLTTPPRVNGADFAAERGWLLLRMGEADAARAVVQSVDNDKYTPKLYQVAMNAALATGDPAELCPIADAGLAATHERGWTLAQAMCSALAGESAEAKARLTAARRRGVARGIDLQLAQKVVGAGPNGGQSVTIEWAGVDALSIWRFGLAIATGVVVPDELLTASGRQVMSWYALAPGIPIANRIAAAEAAAAQGVLSSAALVDLYAAIDEDPDAPRPAGAAAQDLRSAYTATEADARLAALRQLWGARDERPAYARLVLTARAAARMPIRGGVEDAATLIASMLTAGLDRGAARWREQVGLGSDGWALIALSDPDLSGQLSYGNLSSYAGTGSGFGNPQLKQRLLFAGLAGLGRLAPGDIERAAQALDVKIGTENSWTRAMDRAVEANQPGTIVLLAAIGMQTPSWQGVPPAALYRIVSGLRAVGLEGEARMIAAEAIARA